MSVKKKDQLWRIASEVRDQYNLRQWISRDLLKKLDKALRDRKNAPEVFEPEREISKVIARGRNGEFRVQTIEIAPEKEFTGKGGVSVALYSKVQGKSPPVLITAEGEDLATLFFWISQDIEKSRKEGAIFSLTLKESDEKKQRDRKDT